MFKKQPSSSSNSNSHREKTPRRKKIRKSLYQIVLKIVTTSKSYLQTLTRFFKQKLFKFKNLLKFNSSKLTYKIALILFLLGFTYSSALFISQKWNFYALELVKIIGTEKLHPYDLLKELNLKKGTSLLAINSTALEQKLLQRPQIAKAKVTKTYPSTLKILIEEKQVAFLIKTPIQIYAISQFGEILFIGNEIEQHQYFIIEIETPLKQPSSQEHEGLSAFLTYFNQLNLQEQDVQQLFSSIYFGNEILIFAKNEPVTLNLGKELSLEKLRKARYAYLYKKQKNIQKTQIDLRFNFVRFTT